MDKDIIRQTNAYWISEEKIFKQKDGQTSQRKKVCIMTQKDWLSEWLSENASSLDKFIIESIVIK